MEKIKIENIIEQSNNFSKEYYQVLFNTVLSVLKDKKNSNLTEIINELYVRSKLEERIKNFFLIRKMAPGAVMNISTPHINHIITIGNQQEVEMSNGKLVSKFVEMNSDGIFDLASITKLFTSISVLQLISKKKLNLYDKVISIVPQFHNITNLTIEDLLKFAMLKTDKYLRMAKNVEEAEQILFDLKFIPKLDTQDVYNDFAPMVLKYIVEKKSNMDFYEYIEENILKPLNMKSTIVSVKNNPSLLSLMVSENYGISYKTNEGPKLKNIEIGVTLDDKAVALGQPNGKLSGHAGLFSSSRDLEKLGKGLIEGKILEKKWVNVLYKRQIGRTFVDENNIFNATQYFSYLVYVKNPIERRNVVYYGLSDKSFGSAGWTGTKFIVDCANKIVYSLLSNRVHNRLTDIDLQYKDQIYDFRDGTKGIILQDGTKIVDSSRYAHERDEAVVNKSLDLAIMYRMLENILELDKKQDVVCRKLETRIK